MPYLGKNARESPGPINCNIRLEAQRWMDIDGPITRGVCERCGGERSSNYFQCPFFHKNGDAKYLETPQERDIRLGKEKS